MVISVSGCSLLSSGNTKPDIPFKPTLESAHKIRKDVTYEYETVNGTTRVKTLKKNGLYMNEEDVKELKHYIDNMQNELEDAQ